MTRSAFITFIFDLSITPAQYANFTLYLKAHLFELIPNARIWPWSLNSLIGGKFTSSPLASPARDSTLSMDSLQHYYYSVYYFANKRLSRGTPKIKVFMQLCSITSLSQQGINRQRDSVTDS